MDIVSLGKASKTLREIQQLDQDIVAPLAESRFPTVAKRLEWLEGQASKAKVENSLQLDLSQGVFDNTELVNGKIQLKKIGEADLGYTDNIVPIMNSNNQDGVVISHHNYNSNHRGHKAFDRNISSYYLSNSKSGYLSIDFGNSNQKVISKYKISQQNIVSSNIKDWTFEGSNDGSNWEILDERKDIIDWTSSIEFLFENSLPFQMYRINFTNNNGDYYNSRISELELMEKATVSTYAPQGIYESPIIDLGEGYHETKLLDITKHMTSGTVTNIVPPMTSPTSAFGKVTASSEVSQWEAYRLFDGNDSTFWSGNSKDSESEYVAYEFAEKQIVNHYTISAVYGSVGGTPLEWQFQAWDGANWITLDQQSFAVEQWETATGSRTHQFPIINDTAYQKYRILVTDWYLKGTSWECRIGEFQLEYEDRTTFIQLQAATSADGTSFTPFRPIQEDRPPQGRYVKIRAILSSKGQSGGTETFEFDQGSPETKVTPNDFIQTNGDLSLQTNYRFTSDTPRTEGSGNVFAIEIPKHHFKKIQSLQVV